LVFVRTTAGNPCTQGFQPTDNLPKHNNMITKKTKTPKARAILLLVIRLLLTIACQVAESDWWQDELSSHPEGTNSEIIESDEEHSSCDIRKLGNK
jgi:hypothetical protein